MIPAFRSARTSTSPANPPGPRHEHDVDVDPVISAGGMRTCELHVFLMRDSAREKITGPYGPTWATDTEHAAEKRSSNNAHVVEAQQDSSLQNALGARREDRGQTATGQYSSVGIGCVSLVDKNDEVARDTVVALGKDVVRIPSEETEKPDEYPSSTQEQVISHEPQEGKTKKVVVSAVDIRSGDR